MEATFPSKELPSVLFSSKLATITSRLPIRDKNNNFPLGSPQLDAFDHTLSVPALPVPLIFTMYLSVLKLCFEKLGTDRDRNIVEIRIADGVFTDDMKARRNLLL